VLAGSDSLRASFAALTPVLTSSERGHHASPFDSTGFRTLPAEYSPHLPARSADVFGLLAALAALTRIDRAQPRRMAREQRARGSRTTVGSEGPGWGGRGSSAVGGTERGRPAAGASRRKHRNGVRSVLKIAAGDFGIQQISDLRDSE